MKRINRSLLLIFSGIIICIASCKKLDRQSPRIVTNDQIFANEAGTDAYLAQVYRKLPIEDFTYRPEGREDGTGEGRKGFSIHHEWEHFYRSGAACGEMVGPYGGLDIGSGFGYWPYKDIRAINYFMETLPQYTRNFTSARVKELVGEAYFLRAFYYFALAKRYGGVPLVKVVQHYPEQSIDELSVPRDTEEDTWNFIAEDLDSAYTMLPATSAPERANKYVAMALKSRAMLYAGSIAKYGSETYADGEARGQGFVGIDASKANGFYGKAIAAAKLVEQGAYVLYRGSADKIKNYTDIFLDSKSKENILVRNYYAGESERCHSWDATYSPNSGMNYMTSGGLSRAYPTLELVQRWDSLKFVTNADGTPKRYNNLADPFQGLEPRLRATIYFPGDQLRGLPFDTQRGIYPSFAGTAKDEVAKAAGARTYQLSGDHTTKWSPSPDPSTDPNAKVKIGKAGMSSAGDDNTRTGFYVRKYINYNKTVAEVNLFTSTTPWIEFRYAEVLLNRAEADIEIGQNADALICLNDIRDRAGAPALTLADMKVDVVRNERCKELAFENHYWWDIRRWRVADKWLNNARFGGLMPYYVFNENKFIFLQEPETFQRNYNFEMKFYYEPIPGGELAKNPKLAPNNPGY